MCLRVSLVTHVIAEIQEMEVEWFTEWIERKRFNLMMTKGPYKQP